MTRGKSKRPGTRAGGAGSPGGGAGGGGGGTNITKKPRPPLPDDLPDAAEAALDDLLSSSHLRVDIDDDESMTHARSTSEVSLEEIIPLDDDEDDDEEPFTRARSRRLPSRVAPLPSARPATARPGTARPGTARPATSSGGRDDGGPPMEPTVHRGRGGDSGPPMEPTVHRGRGGDSGPPMEPTVHRVRGADSGPRMEPTLHRTEPATSNSPGRPLPSPRVDLPLRAMDADLDDVVDSLTAHRRPSAMDDGINSLDDDAHDAGVEMTTNRAPGELASRASGQLTTSLRTDEPEPRPSGILTTNIPSIAAASSSSPASGASRSAPDRTEPVERFEDDDDIDMDDIGLGELPARKRSARSGPNVLPHRESGASAPNTLPRGDAADARAPGRTTQSGPHTLPRAHGQSGPTTQSGPHTLPRPQGQGPIGPTTQSGPHTLPRAAEPRSQHSAPVATPRAAEPRSQPSAPAAPRSPAPSGVDEIPTRVARDPQDEPATRAASARRTEPPSAARQPVHRNTAPILDDNMFDDGSLGDGSLDEVDLDGVDGAALDEAAASPVAERAEAPAHELTSLTFAVYEESAHLASAHTAITEAGHRVAVAAAGRDGASRVVAAIRNGGIDVVLVTGRGGQTVIDAALAIEPRRPVIIAAGDGSTVEAVGLAAAAGADLATVRPHNADRIAPLAFAAARIDAHRRVAVTARGAEQVLRQRLEDLADAEPGGLLPFEMFQHALELEIKRAKRFEYPLSVALFAVEIAPPPPPAGIRGILRARAGNALINTIRDIDIATQLDHERFLVLLPYTDLKGAASVGKRVIAAVSAGDPVISSGRSFPPRVVGAVAGMRKGEPVSFAKLMKDATRALEQARRDGADLAVQP